MWPDATQTQELLLHAQEGDPRAIGELLDRHRDSLRRMVTARLDRKLQARVDASDIVQDVMIEANRRLADYLRDPRLPFHLWLRQMAKDRMIDAHRRHRLAARRSLDREQSLQRPATVDASTLDLAAQIWDQELTPASAAVRHELEQRFQRALDELNEMDRDVVLMRHVEHLSNQEVALALGLSDSAASMRYLRAMRRLRKVLQQDESQDGTE